MWLLFVKQGGKEVVRGGGVVWTLFSAARRSHVHLYGLLAILTDTNTSCFVSSKQEHRKNFHSVSSVWKLLCFCHVHLDTSCLCVLFRASKLEANFTDTSTRLSIRRWRVCVHEFYVRLFLFRSDRDDVTSDHHLHVTSEVVDLLIETQSDRLPCLKHLLQVFIFARIEFLKTSYFERITLM